MASALDDPALMGHDRAKMAAAEAAAMTDDAELHFTQSGNAPFRLIAGILVPCGGKRSGRAEKLKHGMVVVPILVAKDGDNYVVVDGLHRLAALEMVKGMEPELMPSARVKMIKNHIINISNKLSIERFFVFKI